MTLFWSSLQIQNPVLLCCIGTSAGNTPTFVLESRCPAAAIILPGLTFEIKTIYYFITLYFVVNRYTGCLFGTARRSFIDLAAHPEHNMEKRSDTAGKLLS